MGDYIASRNNAEQQYDAAFHLLNVTFPLVKDPKLLMGVIHNISASMEHAMDAILAYEQQLRLVPNFKDDFQSKFNLFRYKSVRRHDIPANHITQMMELNDLIQLHKQCPVEFQRGNKYVLATKDYKLQVVSINDIKKYLAKSRAFFDRMEQITKINRKE
jgi:hypothetical protein